MEESISFLSESYQLEGLLDKSSIDNGVVITHPHPLYGGDMNNFIVDLIVRAYQKKGFTTLRFNFRGTGKSQGSYDDGTGEQEDVHAALSTLTGSNDDIAPADRIKTMYPEWNPKAQLKILNGADHFYSGCLDELESVLSSHI